MDLLINFNFYHLVYFFTFYSFLGWCVEVSYQYKNHRCFINRGFLNGPFCPIYGSAIVFMVIFLDGFKDNLSTLFILSFFLTSTVEYITGYILEKVFNDKWWDYSEDPLNLHGRICLPYSIIWGFGAVFIIKFVHPFVINTVNNIPSEIGLILFFTIIGYFVIDFSLTLASLIEVNFAATSSNLLIKSNNLILNSFKKIIKKD